MGISLQNIVDEEDSVVVDSETKSIQEIYDVAPDYSGLVKEAEDLAVPKDLSQWTQTKIMLLEKHIPLEYQGAQLDKMSKARVGMIFRKEMSYARNEIKKAKED